MMVRSVAQHARRQADHRGDARPPGGAARRRLRHQRDPGRRARRDADRLRDPEEVRAEADDRRHARHRRHLPGAAHDPGAARHLPRHARGLPGRAAAQLHEPHGDALPGGRARRRRAGRRAVPLGAAHLRAAGRATSACRRRRSGTGSPGSTTWPGSSSSARGPGEDLYPKLWARARRPGRFGARQGALRDDAAARLLRDRVERAHVRVRAVLHQARRRWSSASTSRSTSTSAARSGTSAGPRPSASELDRGERGRDQAQPRVRGLHHPGDRGEPGLVVPRQRAEPRR